MEEVLEVTDDVGDVCGKKRNGSGSWKRGFLYPSLASVRTIGRSVLSASYCASYAVGKGEAGWRRR